MYLGVMYVLFGQYKLRVTKKDEFSPVQTNKFSLTSFICSCVREFFPDNKPRLKASRTSFSTRKLARVYVQQGTLNKGIFVYVLNSCGLVNVVKKKYCKISPTHEQISLSMTTLTCQGKLARLYGILFICLCTHSSNRSK